MYKRQGRTLGYRTANLQALEPHQLLPAEGVYAARARLNPSETRTHTTQQPEGQWDAMVHIGPRPTFNTGDAATVEAHLFDAGEPDLYGHSMEITFVDRLRDIRKFDTPEALVEQLGEDASAAKRALGYA